MRTANDSTLVILTAGCARSRFSAAIVEQTNDLREIITVDHINDFCGSM
jgi:hypothetical protein